MSLYSYRLKRRFKRAFIFQKKYFSLKSKFIRFELLSASLLVFLRENVSSVSVPFLVIIAHD